MDGPDQVKQGARATWAAGDFDRVAETIWDVGDRLAERLEIGPGEEVLDVGAGTGNASIPAALAGASVTASDLTPELLEVGRARAAELGAELRWVEADAEALPFDDACFDVVVSTFGHMFAPRHRVAAEEIARVLRPGGRIGLCCWDPEGRIGGFFRTIATHVPAPPGVDHPPPMWGRADHAAQMFEDTGIEPEFERDSTVTRFDSAEVAVSFYETNFGPIVMAKRNLAPERWQRLRDDLVSYFDEVALTTPDGLEFEGQYLRVLGTRRA